MWLRWNSIFAKVDYVSMSHFASDGMETSNNIVNNYKTAIGGRVNRLDNVQRYWLGDYLLIEL